MSPALKHRTLPEKIIRLKLGPQSYDAILGYNNTGNIGNYLRSTTGNENVFILTDTKVGPHYAARLKEALKKDNFRDIHVEEVPEGEESKSIETWIHLLERVHEFSSGKEEKVLIVNLGGGVIGDLGGFVAATYTRGCHYVQMPTTLLAVVDSALGGKVGVDFAGVKNLIGSFYQPRLVFVDLSLLKTLDAREVRTGLAEVVKYGVIKDSLLFDFMENNHDKLLNLEPEATYHVAAKSLKIKAATVQQDLLDQKDIRIILNYGHTIGHAIEAASGYSYSHGEAISIGMVAENSIACEMGLLNKEKAARIRNLLKAIGLPVVSRKYEVSRILQFLSRDKKFTKRSNRFVLPADIGSVQIVSGVDQKLIEKAVREVMGIEG